HPHLPPVSLNRRVDHDPSDPTFKRTGALVTVYIGKHFDESGLKHILRLRRIAGISHTDTEHFPRQHPVQCFLRLTIARFASFIQLIDGNCSLQFAPVYSYDDLQAQKVARNKNFFGKIAGYWLWMSTVNFLRPSGYIEIPIVTASAGNRPGIRSGHSTKQEAPE